MVISMKAEVISSGAVSSTYHSDISQFNLMSCRDHLEYYVAFKMTSCMHSVATFHIIVSCI